MTVTALETIIIPVSIHYVTEDDVTDRLVTIDILVTCHNPVTCLVTVDIPVTCHNLVTTRYNVPNYNGKERSLKQPGLDPHQEEFPPEKGLLQLNN